MTYYAVAWHPTTDNLGDDLRVLAASRLLPRIDRVLDAERLDAPIPGVGESDRVIALLCGPVLHSPIHWPPEEHVSPVCVGAHFSAQDVWGVPLTDMDGVGREALLRCGPIGCRDERSVRLLKELQLPHTLTSCVTLTLPRPTVERQAYVCCVDVPEQVASVLKEFAPGVGVTVREMSHNLKNASADFEVRMKNADEAVRTYASAQFVVTRRLHCAMACLAVGTPVILLYDSDYEDVTRFAPMNGMVRTQPVDDFVREVSRNGFPIPWRNPRGLSAWREKIENAVAEGIRAAEVRALPLAEPGQAAAWRQRRLELTAQRAEEKIRRLDQACYEGLHEKFRLLLREDAAKITLGELLREPEVERGLNRLALRRALAELTWWEKLRCLWQMHRGEKKPEDLPAQAQAALRTLGWPEK